MNSGINIFPLETFYAYPTFLLHPVVIMLSKSCLLKAFDAHLRFHSIGVDHVVWRLRKAIYVETVKVFNGTPSHSIFFVDPFVTTPFLSDTLTHCGTEKKTLGHCKTYSS